MRIGYKSRYKNKSLPSPASLESFRSLAAWELGVALRLTISLIIGTLYIYIKPRSRAEQRGKT